MTPMPLTFGIIGEGDIEILTPIMRRAFDDDAQKHLGKERGGPPGYDDGQFFHTWLFPYTESVGHKIILDEKVIGGIIVWILPEGHNILGTIFIDPPYQDQGLGAMTWDYIEAEYPETASWRLATPTWADKNHHFYRKCGFSPVESDPLIPPEPETTIYRKDM